MEPVSNPIEHRSRVQIILYIYVCVTHYRTTSLCEIMQFSQSLLLLKPGGISVKTMSCNKHELRPEPVMPIWPRSEVNSSCNPYRDIVN